MARKVALRTTELPVTGPFPKDPVSTSFSRFACRSPFPQSLFAIGVPLAYWLTFLAMARQIPVEAIVALPLVLPPTVLGFYLLIAMGSQGPLGRFWQAAFGHGLAFTFTGLVIASVLYSLPFAVQPLAGII